MVAKLKAMMVILVIGFVALSMFVSFYGLFWLLPVTVASIFIKGLRPYVRKLWVSNDQTVNATLLGNEDHTISGRVGFLATNRSQVGRELERFIDKLFWRGHCVEAIESDEIETK